MSALLSLALLRPRATLAVTALLTLALAAGGLRLELRTEGEALEPEGHRVVEQSAQDAARFRDARAILLLVEARPTTTLTTPQGLRFLREVHRKLGREDVVRPSGVISIAGLPRLDRDAGALSVGGQLDAIPDDARGFGDLLSTLRARPLVDGLLLSRDGRRALFHLPVSETSSAAEAVASLERFRESSSTPDFELLIGGPLVAETELGAQVLRDLALLVPLMLVVIVVILYTMLRCPGGVLIPMLETLIVLVWTFGAMGWAGAPVALVSTILPVVLMAMCITDEIHLLERFVAHGGEPNAGASVRAALRDVGRPIVLTSITTALGFLSFTSTSIAPLRDFGLFAAFGILVAMGLTFSFIPALIVLLPERAFARRGEGPGAPALAAYGRFAARRPGLCFGLGVAALVAVLPGTAWLRVGDSWVENFAPGSNLVRAERAINESFWGSYRHDVVFESEAGAFRDPNGIALLDRFRELAAAAPHVGGTQTHLTPLEEIAAALGENTPVVQLPAAKLWDLFILAEMSESRVALAPLLSERGDAARARLYVKSPDYARAQELQRHLDRSLPALASEHGARFHHSGDLPLASAMVESIVSGQLRSIGWAIVTVAAALLLLTRRVSSLLALVPVVAATSGLFGLMGLAGISLGIATSMFASLTVGVGVDFGIHFLHRFEREREAGRNEADAVRATLGTAGRALFWNAAALSAGFSVLIASSLKPNHSLGLLLAIAILACYAASFLLLPYLVRVGGAGRTAAAALGVALSLLAASPSARAQTCDGSSDPAATALMARLEARARSEPRIQRMQIATHYDEGAPYAEAGGQDPAAKTIWGVTGGDAVETWQLFVFSGPGRMAGTSLLVRDFAGSTGKDETWFYLRAFERFQRLGAGGSRAVVPGTGLSYEDARGFVATDKYRFQRADVAGSRGAVAHVLACPRTEQLAEELGYDSLLIEVEPEREVIRRIDYRRPGGGPFKEYALVDAVRVGDGFFPSRARLTQSVAGFTNDIRTETWRLGRAPPAELFAPDPEAGAFLARLRTLLHAQGLGARIDAEIEAAEARMRIYDERMREHTAPPGSAIGRSRPTV